LESFEKKWIEKSSSIRKNMKNFNYHSTTNTKAATKLASGKGVFLAGGMTLLPAIKLRLAGYSDLINIKKIKGLSGIKVSSKSLRIGATTTHAQVAASKEVGKSIPSLAVLAEGIGDPQVRNRGTIGGSIANNDPAADYPSACLALNAIIHTSKRKIPTDKFFKGMFETDLKKGELIEAVEFEVPEKSAYAKFPNPASRYAIVGVYVAKLKKEVRVAVTGAESLVFRCKKLEDALTSNFSPSAIDNVTISSKGFNSDIHASAEYRAHIIKVMAKKAVSSC
jgi:carbon-monoxide dehydrogenase medium subunit